MLCKPLKSLQGICCQLWIALQSYIFGPENHPFPHLDFDWFHPVLQSVSSDVLRQNNRITGGDYTQWGAHCTWRNRNLQQKLDLSRSQSFSSWNQWPLFFQEPLLSTLWVTALSWLYGGLMCIYCAPAGLFLQELGKPQCPKLTNSPYPSVPSSFWSSIAPSLESLNLCMTQQLKVCLLVQQTFRILLQDSGQPKSILISWWFNHSSLHGLLEAYNCSIYYLRTLLAGEKCPEIIKADL